jgi:hypothetical protein
LDRRGGDSSFAKAREKLVLQAALNDFRNGDRARLKLTSLPRYDELRRDAEVGCLPGVVCAVIEGRGHARVGQAIEEIDQLLASVAAPRAVREARQLRAREINLVGNRPAVVGELLEDGDEHLEMTGAGLAVRWMRLDGDWPLHQLLDGRKADVSVGVQGQPLHRSGVGLL